MPERTDEVLRQQVQLLYDNGTVVLFANLVGAGLVAVMLGPELAQTAYPWCLAVVAVALAGGVVIWAYRRRGGDAAPAATWAWRLTAGSLASGILWGLGCVLLFVPDDTSAQVAIAFAAAAMVAAGVAGLCAWLPAAVGFVTAVLVGMIVALLGQGRPHYAALAGMTALMWLGLVAIAVNFNRMIRRSLSAGVENLALAEALRQARATEAGNQARSWFLAAMSHELRTPLNAILGFSDILRSEAFGPLGSLKYKDYAQDIHRSAEGLLTLVNETLDLSKIESGAIELEEAPVSVAAAVKSAETMVQEAAVAGRVRIDKDLCERCQVLRIDERVLRQVLLILLSNAVRFTPRGGVVTLTTRREADGGLSLRVTDAGPGITADDIAQLTGDFGAADAALAHIREGTGFSLSVAKALVELEDGRFALSSDGATGMSVTATFPPERVLTP
ncbi:MAG: HAMP domain-containing histidine kinase [Proteobacteria bacterium]|nr:HAMP domain-containing histidine kinase [Pseudomonadota bacterium]